MNRQLALAEEADKGTDSSTRHLTKPNKTPARQPEVGFCPNVR